MLMLQVLPTIPSALRAVAALIVTGLFYVVAQCIYLLYFHPLAKYPGPRFAALSTVWKKQSDAGGKHVFVMEELHRKYGDIVRIGPNDLSFANVDAYRDIYGHVGQDKKRFLKTAMYEREEPRIVSVRDPAEHAVQRRALSHAFSARALRDQEVVVHQYVDMLLQQFGNLGENGKKGVNVTNAMNWLTFDIIGDLSFGESFGAIAQASNEWITGIMDWVIYMSLGYYMKKSLFMRLLLPMIWGPKLKNMAGTADKYSTMAKKKAEKRLEMGDSIDRVDFFGHLIKKKEIDAQYLMGNAQTLIIAGSETTATGLASTMFWLTKYPEVLAKLTQEIRTTFKDVSEITGDSTADCHYLHGVIEEALRISPPVAIGLPRECPGTLIMGEYIPQGVTVSCENYAIARDPRYWEKPEEFIPERWIGEGFAGDNKKAFQPFSTGPRACLGINLAYLEMRVMLAKMLHVYDLELETKGIDDWNHACRIMGLWEKPDYFVKFHPRQEAGEA